MTTYYHYLLEHLRTSATKYWVLRNNKIFNINHAYLETRLQDSHFIQQINNSPESAIHTTFSHFAAFFIVVVTKRFDVDRAEWLTYTSFYQSHTDYQQSIIVVKSTWILLKLHHIIAKNVLLADNDPSAGSPTETLLRLLLPLDNLVCKS